LARRNADFAAWCLGTTESASADLDREKIEPNLHGLRAALAPLWLDQSALDSAIAEGRRLDPPTGMPEAALIAKCTLLEAYLLPADSEILAQLAVPDRVLAKYGHSMDLVARHSRRSLCFTKSYTRYVRGTGSLLAEGIAPNTSATFEPLAQEERRGLRLRFFAPTEIAAIHGFPPSFDFPPEVSKKKQYELLGNSLSVPVVAGLMRVLFSSDPQPAAG
jgi:hypothetical protein